MRDLKRAFKLMKYTYHYQSKDEKFMPLILFAVGIAALLGCIKDAFYIVVASPMLVLSIAYVGSYYYSLTCAYMAGASGLRKNLNLMIPNLFMIVGVLWAYLLITIALTILVHFYPRMALDYAKGLLDTAIMTGTLIIFNGICDKYYWTGVILVAIVLIPSAAILPMLLRDMDTFLGRPLNLQWGLVIYGMGLLISTVIACVLRVVLYKVPAMRGRLGKQMLHAM